MFYYGVLFQSSQFLDKIMTPEIEEALAVSRAITLARE
jgi:hypothetical protein